MTSLLLTNVTTPQLNSLTNSSTHSIASSACLSCGTLKKHAKHIYCRKCYTCYKKWLVNPPECAGYRRQCSNKVHTYKHYQDGTPINWCIVNNPNHKHHYLHIYSQYCWDCEQFSKDSKELKHDLTNTPSQKSTYKLSEELNRELSKELSLLPRVKCASAVYMGCPNYTHYKQSTQQGFKHCQECNRRFCKFGDLPLEPCANAKVEWIKCCYKVNYDSETGIGNKYCIECSIINKRVTELKNTDYNQAFEVFKFIMANLNGENKYRLCKNVEDDYSFIHFNSLHIDALDHGASHEIKTLDCVSNKLQHQKCPHGGLVGDYPYITRYCGSCAKDGHLVRLIARTKDSVCHNLVKEYLQFFKTYLAQS